MRGGIRDIRRNAHPRSVAGWTARAAPAIRMTPVLIANDAGPHAGRHNGTVLNRLRRLVSRLRPVRNDVLLALVFTVAAIIWALVDRHTTSGDGPLQFVKVQASRVKILPNGTDAGPQPWPSDGMIHAPTSMPASDVAAHVVMNVLATAPLVIRRVQPFAALAIALGGVFVFRDGLNWPGFIAILIMAYSLVAFGRRVLASLGVLFVAATLVAHEFANSVPPLPGWLSPFALLLPVGLFAATIRSTRARADAAALRASALEREKEAGTRAAVAEERARIARELHDVVSHHVSVMVIQAGAAGKVIDEHPDLASGALRAIEASGRQAMGELRHLLGLVAPLDADLRPQPGLADLDALVVKVRAAGQPVTLRRSAHEVPYGADLTAYRVVQEGLTNALRYAPGAATAVEVDRHGDELVVEVRNDAPAAPTPDVQLGGGTGLVGLAERLRLCRGTLESGRRLGGGYRLSARIPWESE